MSNLPAVSSSSATKFKIEQKVSDTGKKAPYAVERSLNPSDVVIKRRFGEGSKPLFQRDDIAINRSNGDDSDNPKSAQQRRTRYSSSESSSPERYRPRDTHASAVGHGQKLHNTHSKRSTASATSQTPHSAKSSRRQSLEKVPYYVDQKREKDRLRRVYGTTVPRHRRSFSPRSKSRSKSPLPSSTRTHLATSAYYSHRQKSTPRERHNHLVRSERRRRSTSKDRRYHSTRSGARRRTRSRSRSRSRSHSPRSYSHRDRDRNRDRDRDRKHDQSHHETPMVAPPQIITIPVPVSDYPYAYPGWPPQAAWGAPVPHAGPPPRFAPYPMPAAIMPPMRPQYGMPPLYNGPMYRPRYPNHSYNPRPPRGSNMRPRHS